MKPRFPRKDAPLRRVRQIRGYGALMVAIVLVASVLWAPVAEPGRITAVVVAGAIWIYGGLQLWLAGRTPDTARYESRYVDPNALPIPDQIRYFQQMLIMAVVVFPLLSAWVAYDLNRLESGAVESVELWAPVGFVHEHLGYWPAVLTAPAVGVLFAIVFFVKLKRLRG